MSRAKSVEWLFYHHARERWLEWHWKRGVYAVPMYLEPPRRFF